MKGVYMYIITIVLFSLVTCRTTTQYILKIEFPITTMNILHERLDDGS